MRVVVLHDRILEEGANPDHKDVLVQAEAVSQALKELAYEPMELQCSLDLKGLGAVLTALRPSFVFNLVESVEGCGQLIHLVPALLDHLAVPYTGSKTDSVYVTSNKLLTKKVLSGKGISTPLGFSMEELRKKDIPLDGPYIIKSIWEHASIGLDEDSVVIGEDSHQMLEEMRRRQGMLRGGCLVERYVEGREFNLSLLASEGGPQVLPPAEILFEDYPSVKRRVVGYRAKWEEASFEYHHTQRRFDFSPEDDPLVHELGETAKRCWDIFEVRGYGRVDFRVDAENRPWVLEINVNPCLSPDAGFMAAAARAGLSFKEVVRRIIQDSIGCSGG